MNREISPSEREEIENYLFLDEELLYSLIPAYAPEYDNTRFSPHGQTAAGRKIFQSMQQELYNLLCKEWKLCKQLDDPTLQDTTQLVVLIGDLISTTAVGIPPFLIASILVKIGVREFCNCGRKGR
jgi:hypothetical protein